MSPEQHPSEAPKEERIPEFREPRKSHDDSVEEKMDFSRHVEELERSESSRGISSRQINQTFKSMNKNMKKTLKKPFRNMRTKSIGAADDVSPHRSKTRSSSFGERATSSPMSDGEITRRPRPVRRISDPDVPTSTDDNETKLENNNYQKNSPVTTRPASEEKMRDRLKVLGQPMNLQIPQISGIPVNWNLLKTKKSDANEYKRGPAFVSPSRLETLNKTLDNVISQVNGYREGSNAEYKSIMLSLEKFSFEADVRFTIEIAVLICFIIRMSPGLSLYPCIGLVITCFLATILRLYFIRKKYTAACKAVNDRNVELEENKHSPEKIESFKNKDCSGMKFNFLEGSGLSFQKTVYDMLTESEKRLFNVFKKDFTERLAISTSLDRTKPYEFPDEFNMLRFLQADKFNVKLASKRLVSTVCWRQSKEIDKLYKSPPPELAEYRKYRVRVMLGRDKLQRPIIMERIGNFFGNSQVPKAMDMEQWLRCCSYETMELFEEFRKTSIDNGKVIHQMTYIGDLKGLKFSSIRKMSFLNTIKEEVEVHFPEISGPIILINAPAFMARVWSMVTKILDPTVVAKISIHSDVPKDLFEETFGKDIIPIEYGGKNPVEF